MRRSTAQLALPFAPGAPTAPIVPIAAVPVPALAPTPASAAASAPPPPVAPTAPRVHVPSEYQLAIWQHAATNPRHLVVEALAGSAKTSSLTAALHYIPGDIALTSFGTDIVRELKERVATAGLQRRVRAATLHSFGMGAVLDHLKPANREPDKYKTKNHILLLLAEAGLAAPRPLVDKLQAVVEWAKLSLAWELPVLADLCTRFELTSLRASSKTSTHEDEVVVEDDVSSSSFSTEGFMGTESAPASFVQQVLLRCANDTNAFDFDDMIWLPLWYNLPLRQYANVLIDERQDLSPMQHRLAQRLIVGGGRMISVGDTRQALYGFRGADATNGARMVEELGAVLLPLPISYRCPKSVVAEAQRYVPEFQAAPWAPDGVVRRVPLAALTGLVGPGDFVLSRSNAPLALLAAELRQLGLPVVQLGREEGRKLLELIRRSRQQSCSGLNAWLTDHWERRSASLGVKLDDEGEVEGAGTSAQVGAALWDRIQTVKGLCATMPSIEAITTHVRTLYSDEARKSSVVLSTVHRAKGQEADRVFLLWGTFKRASDEENNVRYVAITRAKVELTYVEGDPNAYYRKKK